MEALRVGLAAAERSHSLFVVAGAQNGFADERSIAMYEAQGDPTSTTIPRRSLAVLSLAAGRRKRRGAR